MSILPRMLLTAGLLGLLPCSAQVPPQDPDARAEALLKQMSLEEKIEYLGGHKEFSIRAVPRLGIPEILLSDGPMGCRSWGGVSVYKASTGYGAGIALTAAWDPELARRMGAAMGRDCRARGVHLLLAPGVNINRSPLCGRNFEYMGEDPLLASKTAVGLIQGLRSEGVLATIKHFAANNQEWNRNWVSSDVDERTLREIYLPAFQAAVQEGQVASVMSAYNPINGVHSSHHHWLLNELLKQEWGFKGIVMSDWGAVHDTLGATLGGMDLEMPSGVHMNRERLLPLVRSGNVPEAVIDDKVRRILRTIIAAGFLDRPQRRHDLPPEDPSSTAIALEGARASTVLLKNAEGLLPLDAARTRRILVVGPNAHPAVSCGSGSGYVDTFRSVSVLEGIKAKFPQAKIVHHPGLKAGSGVEALGKPCFSGPVTVAFHSNTELQGTPVSTSTTDRVHLDPRDRPPVPGLGSENYSVRWTGTIRVPADGKYTFLANADDGIRVLLDGRKVLDDWSPHGARLSNATVTLSAAGTHTVVVEYFQGGGGAIAQFGWSAVSTPGSFQGTEELVREAKAADVVVACMGFGQFTENNSAGQAYFPGWPEDWARHAGLVEAENSDRTFALHPAQEETLRVVGAANPSTIVILNTGGGVDPGTWLGPIPALLAAWYPGQEGGTAIAEILCGDVNPSAKLPVTFGRRYEDYPSAAFYNLKEANRSPYSEGIFVGYRGFDAKQTEPLFCFGHGLSYTRFAYENLKVQAKPGGGASLSFTLKNTGKREGAEVAQVYIAPPPGAVPRPPKELKAYTKISLKPGESKAVTLDLDPKAFAYWHPEKKTWTSDPGSYGIWIGASSRDIKLKGAVQQ